MIAQARHGRGARVVVKQKSHYVYGVIPKVKEWMSILTCVNVQGQHIPNFYIFIGRLVMRN
jgi:hypothetical protein